MKDAKPLTEEELAEYEQGAEEIAVGTAIGRWSDNDLARLLATIRARDAEIALLNERCQVYADQWGEDAGRDSDTIAELRAEVERLRESESAMRERMEWTVDDNAKQRVKVSDLTARVAELESEKAAYGVHASRLERKNAELRELCGEAADFMRDNLETAPKGLYTRLRAAKEGKDV